MDICRNRYTSCVCVFKISRSRICNLVSDHRDIAESSKRSRTRVYEIEIAMYLIHKEEVDNDTL
jgi:hypothetical protein